MSYISPADVGARITVRRRLPDGRATDLVGDLESWDDGLLAIRRRGGDLVQVPASEVVIGHVVGPSPRAAIELEGVTARGWPAIDQEWLGQWWLRAADGFTARANAVRPLGSPGLDLDEALDRARAWYSERNLPARVQTVVGTSLDRELRRRGWVAAPDVSVMTVTIERALSRLHPISTDAVELHDKPSSGWLGLFRGGDPPPPAVPVLTGPPEAGFATVPSESTALAIGRAAVEEPWVGLTAIEVAETARRRGYAKAVIAALLQWARERGAMRAYLEVLASNQPAIALYESLSFTEHHRYVCRESPGRRPARSTPDASLDPRGVLSTRTSNKLSGGGQFDEASTC